MAPTLRRGAVVSATAAVTLAVAGLSPALAQAAGPSPRTTLDDAPAWTTHAVRVGQTPAGQLQHLTAVLALRDPAGAESLAAAVSDPASAQYGAFVTPAQWRARFAPRAADVAAVTAWLRAGRLHRRGHPGQPPHHQLQRHHRPGREGLRHRPADLPQVGVHRQRQRLVGVGPPGPRRHRRGHQRPRHLGPAQARPHRRTRHLPRRPGDHERRPRPARPRRPTRSPPRAGLPQRDPLLGLLRPEGRHLGAADPHDPLTYAPCGYKPGQLQGAYGVETG